MVGGSVCLSVSNLHLANELGSGGNFCTEIETLISQPHAIPVKSSLRLKKKTSFRFLLKTSGLQNSGKWSADEMNPNEAHRFFMADLELSVVCHFLFSFGMATLRIRSRDLSGGIEGREMPKSIDDWQCRTGRATGDDNVDLSFLQIWSSDKHYYSGWLGRSSLRERERGIEDSDQHHTADKDHVEVEEAATPNY